MKNVFVLLTACMLTLVGCLNRASAVKDFVPGVYVRSFQLEYSFGMDTIFIVAAGAKSASYILEEHTAFQKTVDGKLLPVKLRKTRYLALFDAKAMVLREQRLGRIYSFDKDRSILYAGGESYTKIK